MSVVQTWSLYLRSLSRSDFGGLIDAVTSPALVSTRSVATTFLPSFRRSVSVPASETRP